ncbi:K(+)-transporting ATPase subunit B [Leptospira langatensis]|uniref:Potassium-transporting ATPase ATP-binding subunit n=1 Tax=Leptospira langatensis TaxID=2484983 RepID=A0A5F1ZX23_9LEPT|nr:potassium-transporting ATPase subunit KdpB [Leptospira langatensis]TGJ98310.1 K(+)-transporting ATPase subunit B [Leptospira langatensis]TGL43224.1 K(+)-transporting ATPase subunit B [Leptospira langatensis]
MKNKNTSFFQDPKLILRAVLDSFLKLDPRIQWKNPVMFLVYVGAILTTVDLFSEKGNFYFGMQISLWLWATVLFANFAEALAEGRGKAKAESLKKTRKESQARKLNGSSEISLPSSELRTGDKVICEAGDLIPGDGEVIQGIASVDESAITGESAPVIRESGGDRSAVTGGTKVLSDKIIVQITTDPGKTFLDKMISLVEGASRQKTPNEIALSILLSALSLVFLVAITALVPAVFYSQKEGGGSLGLAGSFPALVGLLVCLIPTTIGGLLSAIGISGMDRLMRRNVIAKSGRAIEAAGDIDVLLLDKTGTITLGNRMATRFVPSPGISERTLADAAQLSSLSDETPEGRSIVVLAKEKFGLRARNLSELGGRFVPFTAKTKMSGVDFDPSPDRKSKPGIRKGASESIRNYIVSLGGEFPREVTDIVDEIAREGGTPLVVSEGREILGVVHLKDIVKGGIRERFARLRQMGIRTVMITGDNPLTAAAIAAEAGVDDFIAEATPETKLKRIREEQAGGKLVAMIGDGTNDAPALAQADVGVAMNTGTQTAREAGNMIDLDSNPTKLIEIVEIGKQLLMTRGSLTTFSIANDVSKYFVILPAMFAGLYPVFGKGALSILNILGFESPESAVLSAVIFNALILVFLVPLALKGVEYKPIGADSVLARNVFIYGFGGLILPFLAIKLIDMILKFTKGIFV